MGSRNRSLRAARPERAGPGVRPPLPSTSTRPASLEVVVIVVFMRRLGHGQQRAGAGDETEAVGPRTLRPGPQPVDRRAQRRQPCLATGLRQIDDDGDHAGLAQRLQLAGRWLVRDEEKERLAGEAGDALQLKL